MNSFFAFITNSILRSNLDKAFDHIIDLTALSESKQYKSKPILLSSLRKTIIIHIAAIVEALLLWKLKQIVTTQKIELDDEWKYPDISVLHKIDDSKEVVAGIRYREKKDIDELDFNRLIGKCCKHQIIKTTSLAKNIDKVRRFRNRLHIGSLVEIEREYTKDNLEFCFKIAEKVQELVSK